MLQPADSSFRDPAGFVFRGDDGLLYRSVSRSYQTHYEHLMQSGLYQSLVDRNWLVAHRQATPHDSNSCYLLQPDEVPQISYPYEWCFGQLKDAALLTLDIQLEALKYGMALKDASAYNVVFRGSKPLFIDTLSFELHTAGKPWVAYKQFCQHFLAPLALAAYRAPELIKLLQTNLDGIPLALASKLLPAKSYLALGVLLHVHLHAKAQQKLSQQHAAAKATPASSQQSVLHLVTNLRSIVSSLSWQPDKTVWAAYYTDNNNYTDASMQHKEQLVDQYLTKINAHTVWDVGANTGRFSTIAAQHATQVISTDFDYGAVELLYQQVKRGGNDRVLPLLSDITNPSPGIGWGNKERASFLTRMQPDLILALAVVHHLAIANNIPLAKIAELFASNCQYLVVEFVPKEDSQVAFMLQAREDIFDGYTAAGFEQAFLTYFNLLEKRPIEASCRTLYLLQRK